MTMVFRNFLKIQKSALLESVALKRTKGCLFYILFCFVFSTAFLPVMMEEYKSLKNFCFPKVIELFKVVILNENL